MASSTAFVALLRGVNVGGKNKLPMADLLGMVEEAGGEDVRTFIQSGNVLFRSTKAASKAIVHELEAALDDRFGHPIPVVLRSGAELDAVIERNPFAARTDDGSPLHVGFLATKPKAASAAKLALDRSPPDTFEVLGREIYLWVPNGMAKTRLTTPYLDRCLGTTTTVRNWRTTLKLRQLLAE